MAPIARRAAHRKTGSTTASAIRAVRRVIDIMGDIPAVSDQQARRYEPVTRRGVPFVTDPMSGREFSLCALTRQNRMDWPTS
ncbi:hypothetical protein GCM10011400_70900 [Paraburkholderia caffeinilytica]|uniref:Uncharacterized protein n=1 Tax=Paraburkholderia caffeinilytica TaxID=1761016 RepID=A0ABQ1NG55_9BURK|nr:hypothetical protein GCM10011400_70900 [Paraburkholderia caffeinilytica]